jgi:hypothetical protein
MALSTELREALASRRPRFRNQARLRDDPDDDPDPDDSGPYPCKDRKFFPVLSDTLALPPPSPDWSHLLSGRPHSPATVLSAFRALLAVGCRLSIRPREDTLLEAVKCRSAGDVRQLLASVYGDRGLAIAYQLAGREQPHRTAGPRDPVVTNNEAAPLNCDPLEPGFVQAVREAPTRLQRWFLAPPREPPRWRTSLPSDGMDDGAWVG